jgi:catechol 2,3-dioxygenase-like lactoylglutathione lyase family enzyme
MSIKKLDHISITAGEVEKTLEFYKTFLGFEIISKTELPALNMNIFILKNREELIEILEPLGTKTDGGLKHIAFLSDNIEEDFKDFKEKGAVFATKEIQNFETLSFFFVKSPSGELVEIIYYK